MSDQEELISKTEAMKQIRLSIRRTALLYHYFAKTLTDTFGEKKGNELIEKAVEAYGGHIGRAAKTRAIEKGLALTPENFESDLPELAFSSQMVKVDDEQRLRVYHCPLAKVWLGLGDTQAARLYCWVDQAKMKEFNPQYTYVHLKNILDGDPYCELVVREDIKDQTDKTK
jgi:predicted ArsR family transcriptional regulator